MICDYSVGYPQKDAHHAADELRVHAQNHIIYVPEHSYLLVVLCLLAPKHPTCFLDTWLQNLKMEV